MREDFQVKVCGITRREDAELAIELGTDFLGFIFHQASPRSITLATYREISRQLPPVKRVYVQVRPEPAELKAAAKEGFDYFQLHFAADESPSLLEAWVETVTVAKLWLAPRIPPGDDFPEVLLPYAETFLIDTYRKGAFGGTGETGDWGRFREWAAIYRSSQWILAGGLSPDNIKRALKESGASTVDVNSGIEAIPGVKDHGQMRAFFEALRRQ